MRKGNSNSVESLSERTVAIEDETNEILGIVDDHTTRNVEYDRTRADLKGPIQRVPVEDHESKRSSRQNQR